MKTFKLEVITPEKMVYDGPVRSLVVPAEGGSLGVLAGHAALLTPIVVGDAKIIDADGEEHHLLVSTGFLEVENDNARLLVEGGEREEDIDPERARHAEERARQRLEQRSDPDFDLARAEAALSRAMTRQKIFRRRGSTGS